MAEAECLNENCDKDPWVLTKRLDEYSGNGPTCPDCGTTNVRVLADGAGEQTPAKAESASSGAGELVQHGDLPGQGELAAEGAAGASKGAYALVGDVSDQEAAQLLGEGLDNMKNSILGYFRRRNAEQRKAEAVELGEPEQVYPSCECGRVFKSISLEADYVTCPECGKRYPIKEAG